MKIYKGMPLNQFIIRRQEDLEYATGELSRLLSHVGVAAKIVHREINNSGIIDFLGEFGSSTLQNSELKKLDVFADSQFIEAIKASGDVCGIASEENHEIVTFDNILSKDGKYIICMDPLDGSANIDVNVSVGTIFSIYQRISKRGEEPVIEDFLQEGTKQVAAGYIIYGSSTMLVYTTGRGVNGFTLDPSIGEFCLSHLDIKTPEDGHIYSINEGYYTKFSDGIKKYIKYCQENNEETQRPYTSRYIGSLVADFHRNLLKGGIYIYPYTTDKPKGKLFLSYECNPIAFIAEQAGGRASDGHKRILEIKPKDLRERVPFFTGSINMVKTAETFIKNFNNKI